MFGQGYARCTMVGNLTREPELKYTQGGTAKCKFGIAVNRKYTNSEKELKESVDFFNILVWGAAAENCATYLCKGQQVLVDCRPQLVDFENDDGERIRYVEFVANAFGVVFGDKPKGKSNGESDDESEPESDEAPKTKDGGPPF